MEVEVNCCKVTLASAGSMSVRISNLWATIWTQYLLKTRQDGHIWSVTFGFKWGICFRKYY